MNTTYTSTAIIRQRGQLTIPDELRQKLDWLTEGSVVSVSTDLTNTVKITPYTKHEEKKIDWKKLRIQIERVRSFKGKRGNLSQFIIEDRESH